MSRECDIIGSLLSSSTDFEATSGLICSFLEAVKEECSYAEMKNIEKLIVEEHDKRNLPHPNIIRRMRAIKKYLTL